MPSNPDPHSDRRALARRLLPPIVVGLVVALAFVGLYTAALHSPRPHGLTVAVVGPPALEQQLQGKLDAAVPGAFEIERYPTPDSARRALLDRDADGALIATGAQPRLLVAGAAGPAGGEAMRTAFGAAAAAGGQKLAVTDVAPLPPEDSRGMSTFFTVVGATLASLLFGAVLFATARDVPTRARLAATTVFAALVGLLVALTVDTLVGALSGAFWGIAGIAALLGLAVALPTAALSRLAGPAGVGVAALILLLLAMSASGGPVGYQFLPDFYNTISQALPGGAALTAIRNVTYFDGAATLVPILTLIAWALFGLVLELAAGAVRRARAANAARPAGARSASPTPAGA